MARRSAQSVLKRAREQALREKRELKQAKKDARAERRRGGDELTETETEATEPEVEAELSRSDDGTLPTAAREE